MNVLLIGSGGREHAIAWKLAESPKVSRIFAAPGNPGIAAFATCLNVGVNDFDGLVKCARDNRAGLVVIGPEDPLAAGLADVMKAAGFKVFGPSRDAARLEADKWFAKELMRQQSVPTSDAKTFTSVHAAEEYIKARDEPLVIKASGLAKGKGVSVCYRQADALVAIDQIMRRQNFGAAGERVVIEELLMGPEVSMLAFVDGANLYTMPSCQDHKTIDDGDTGPMTGGMGAYSPTPLATPELIRQIEHDVFIPILDGLARDHIEYKGVLYAGMMLTEAGPRVLEFNCRFGDPETQPLMMRLKSDLLELFLAVADGTLDQCAVEWDVRPALSVVASSRGYPAKMNYGDKITGIEEAEALGDVKVFHSGTKEMNDKLYTDGGRVLAVTALGATIKDAQDKAYAAMALVHFDGMHYRRDIGHHAFRS